MYMYKMIDYPYTAICTLDIALVTFFVHTNKYNLINFYIITFK